MTKRVKKNQKKTKNNQKEPKLNRNKKPGHLTAASLLYAIFVSLIIGMICSSFIVVSYYGDLYFQDHQIQKSLMIDANSGIQLLLSDQSQIAPDQITKLDLFDDEQHIVELKRKAWGVYEVIQATSTKKRYKETKIALTGVDINHEDRMGLYMTDRNKPLSLCGQSIIKGKTYLPRSGVKRAYIEGQNFIGNELIQGTKATSSSVLPPVNEQLVQSSIFYLNEFSKANDSIVHFDDLAYTDSIVNPFENSTLLIHSNGQITLNDLYLKGNIIIRSERKVTLSSSCETSDILIYAPNIKVEEGFNGTVQLYASDSLVVASKCSLSYPSSLALYNNRRREENQYIALGENSILEGAVFLKNDYKHPRSRAILSIGKNAVVEGLIYCNDYVELQGKVHGSIYCDRFTLKTPSSVYENHLLNAEVDPYKLSKYYAGIPLMESDQPKKIVKWLK